MGAQDVKQIEAEDLQQNGVDSSSGGQPEKKGFVKLIRNGLSKKGQIVRWAKKGGLAVLDQGFFSGANFLVNILLARWLAPKEYGAFAVALSVFYLLAGFHTAVLTEPMMVFGAGKYREHFRKYLGMLFWGHWAVSALIAIALGIAAFVMARLDSAAMAQALAGLAIASPFLLLLWLTRRAPYVEMHPQWAVVGSGVNLLVTLGGVFLLWRLGLLSSLTGLVLLGAAGAVASLALLLHIRPQVVGFVGNPNPRMVLADHRGYGMWSLSIPLLMWVPEGFVYIWLPFWFGLESSGVVRAYINIVAPLLQSVSAASLLLLPYFSKLMMEQGAAVMQKRVAFLLRLLVLVFVPLAIGFALFRMSIVDIFYGGKYKEFASLLLILPFLPMGVSFNMVLGSLLRAMEKINAVFLSYVVTAVVSVITSLLFIPLWNIYGAVLSMVVARLTTSVVLFVFYRRIINVRMRP